VVEYKPFTGINRTTLTESGYRTLRYNPPNRITFPNSGTDTSGNIIYNVFEYQNTYGSGGSGGFYFGNSNAGNSTFADVQRGGYGGLGGYARIYFIA